MTQSDTTIGTRGGGIGRGIVLMLALAVFVNYVDRGNLATAAPLIKGELKLTNYQIGLLVSAFFWCYTPGQLLAGLVAEELGAALTLALGLAIWSLATTLSGFATGFIVLLLLRLMLGIGESVTFPASSKLLAQNLPTARLGAANGLIGMGLALGPAFGTLVGGLMMAKAGWRPTFLVFGLVSLLWLVPWFAITRGRKRDGSREPSGAPAFLDILKHREAWGACLGHLSGNYAFYFFIYWLPLYLVRARGFSLAEMAEAGGIIYVIYAFSSLATGHISDYWIKRGASDNRVRKTFVIASHVGVGACLLVTAVAGTTLSLVGLYLAGVFYGFHTASIFTIGQTLAGPRAGGKWIALQNGVGNLAGILGPLLTGYVVDITGGFGFAFAIASLMAFAGAFAWGLVIPRITPLDWTRPAYLDLIGHP